MGSTGWIQCYWCSEWGYNLYIPDGVCRPLCDNCLLLQRPPNRPDYCERQTAALARVFCYLLPSDATELIAAYVAGYDHP